MPPATIAQLERVTVEIGEDWMRLREISRRRNKLQWTIPPKVHKLQHIPWYATILNPRHVQCYGEESAIGTTSQVWQKTMRGRYGDSAESIVLLKRILGLFLRFES